MARMGEKSPTISALPFLPKRISLTSLRQAVQSCEGCPLFRHATQAVFGEGQKSARVMLVGEQPGNEEDLQGRPFVGPAGRLLDDALQSAGIDRHDTYVTNVVKHFKWEPRRKRRLHKKPNAREIAACIPWLEEELRLLKPQVLVCLGATAAQALLGRDFKITLQRGKLIPGSLAPNALATIHPSSILRQPTTEDRQREMTLFIADLKVIHGLLSSTRD